MTAVWASENTREAVFDAMKRKETYATTGPRMTVRFFGGWEFDARDAGSRLPANTGYAKGVPMGGDLLAAPAGARPTFLVAAMKDPYSGNLDRIQIVKGWMGRIGRDARAGGRRGVVGRPGAGGRRQAPARRQHRRRGERDVDEHPSARRSSSQFGRTRSSTRSRARSTTHG